jgi:hypothetical protein
MYRLDGALSGEYYPLWYFGSAGLMVPHSHHNVFFDVPCIEGGVGQGALNERQAPIATGEQIGVGTHAGVTF